MIPDGWFKALIVVMCFAILTLTFSLLYRTIRGDKYEIKQDPYPVITVYR